MDGVIDQGAHPVDAPLHTFEARAVLLDIEGTISPIRFVRDVLFGYSRTHLARFIAARRGDPVVAAILEQVSLLAGGGDPVAALEAWQARDEKAPPLKKIQGLIWNEGYRSGAFRSPIFADALAALRRWKAAGLPLYIYSSGSVQAQLQFFEFNEAGDLRALFSGHYDTDIGPKIEAASYMRIASQIGVPSQSVVFLSDNPAELEAASAVGFKVVHVVKDAAAPAPQFPEITDFEQVDVSLG
ncbi:acireductone synthase [Hyphomicrobium sp. LHD-15]|uniref:acireductone synthase n=1 Tax=Hyphomicrobium sp. LHD-15 TaxID=3072142 RepID=UPI00280D56ED|nr:acireductone synthase [Hyphomicrobium sp. LHD-15]MDQ8698482.1 acireductone synthase [Hyphomicrobium sp. LHD-15]